jgi:hypothetical protein
VTNLEGVRQVALFTKNPHQIRHVIRLGWPQEAAEQGVLSHFLRHRDFGR